MPTTLIPKKSDVIIHPLMPPDTTSGGLILKSKAHSKKHNQGIIIALGEEAREQGLEIAQHIIYNPFSGSDIAVEDGGVFVVFHWMHVEAILAESSVRLIDTETVKKLIQDRMLQIRQKHLGSEVVQGILTDVEDSLVDRINQYIITEGFQWGF